MDEDSADFGEGGRVGGVEGGGVALDAAVGHAHGVTAAEGAAEAPASAGDEGGGVVCGGGDEVGLVGDELAVDAEGGADGAVDLRGGVIVFLEAADGLLDEGHEGGDVVGSGCADGEGLHGVIVGGDRVQGTGPKRQKLSRKGR